MKNNPDAKIICNGSVGRILEKENITYTKLANGETTEVKGVLIEGFGLKHAPIFRDYEQVENTGYLFGGKLFYPGDAFHNPKVPVDILAFPIGGPWSNISQSLEYVIEVRPRIAFPVHDGNLIRHGITTRLPSIKFPENEIDYISLEIGKETELG